MKIESGFKEKRLKELEPGDLFFFQPAFYIKTDGLADELCECVDLETGFIELIGPDVKVGIVEDVVLKIGGYYK